MLVASRSPGHAQRLCGCTPRKPGQGRDKYRQPLQPQSQNGLQCWL